MLGVLASSGLAAIAAAGPTLYVSSAATAAVHQQAAGQCGADLGVRLFLLPDEDVSGPLAAAAAALRHTQPPIVTGRLGPAPFTIVGRDDPPTRTLVVMHRPDQERELSPSTTSLRPGEALLPDWELAVLSLRIGDELEVQTYGDPDVPRTRLRVAGTYPAVATAPVSSYWCGLVRAFKPNERGDYPPPVAFVAAETAATLVETGVMAREWELRPDAEALTRDDARALATRFDRLVDAHIASDPRLANQPIRFVSTPQRLGPLVGRANQIATSVAKTVGPVALAGFVATVAVLVASALLVARSRQRELRLLAVRGVRPRAVWARLAGSLALPVLGGAVLGLAATVLAVRAFGPASQFEPRVLRSAAFAVAGAALASLGVLVGVAHAVGQRLVDAPPRHRHRWLRALPWELVAVIAVAASYRRLDRLGGVQLAGAKAYGGDIGAQAYPLLLLVAALAVLARPTAFMLRRARFVGRSWRPSVQLGVRRVVAERGVSVGLLLATALAVASLVSARVLTDSAVQALADKARTFLGSDVAIGVNEPADALGAADAARTTTVARQDVRAGELSVQVLGVDLDTFARAAAWRGDEASTSLAGVLGRLRGSGANGAVRAIVVGTALPETELRGPGGSRLAVEPVLSLRTFPGYRNPGPVVVVDRQALARTDLPLTYEVWWRSPPADAAARLTAAGLRVYNETRTSVIFDTTSFLAVRWSYALLAAFGVVIAAVTALAQLLVLDARRRSRQAAYVLTARMGLGARSQFTNLLTEVGLPIAGGGIVGFALGVVAARTSVARLDTLRNVQPHAVAVVAGAPALAVVVATIVVAGALAAWGFVALIRARPMEVLRETA